MRSSSVEDSSAKTASTQESKAIKQQNTVFIIPLEFVELCVVAFEK
jgi:hypothetical protein